MIDLDDFMQIVLFVSIFTLGCIITFLLIPYYKPTYSDIQPSNYFSNFIRNNISEIPDFNISMMLNTSSMLPTIPQGSIVYTIAEYNISIGDIVIINLEYNGYNEYENYSSAHRVVDIDHKNGNICYITKGDNLRYDDNQCFLKNETYGKVVGVLY